MTTGKDASTASADSEVKLPSSNLSSSRSSQDSIQKGGGYPINEDIKEKSSKFGFPWDKSAKAKSQSKSDKNNADKDHSGKPSDPRKELEQKLENLDEDEARVLRQQLDIPEQHVTFFTLFRYASTMDKMYVILGVFFAVVHGVALPMFTLVMSSILNTFSGFFASDKYSTPQKFQHQTDHLSLYFVYIGVGILVSSILESVILVDRGEKIAGIFRKLYMKSIIRQNIAFFDKLGGGEVTTHIINDTNAIQIAISEKLGNVVQGIATFITALVVAFCLQWKLACILLSAVAFNVVSATLGGVFMMKFMVKSDKFYSKGSTIAEEAFSAARNTVAFGAQERLAEKFDVWLRQSQLASNGLGNSLSCMLACLWSTMFFTYALAYWEGSRMIASGEASIGHIFAVIVAMLIGAFQLGNVAPNFRYISKGIAACKALLEAINRVPTIDSYDTSGDKLDKVEGHIHLQNVRFRYPSRPDVLVLPDFSLDVPAGSTVALVGSSGSGKSTIVGILERFYLPLSGEVTLDGVPISSLNVQWLRQQIGYVQQEPTLFNVSIYENISYGLIGTDLEDAPEELKRERVIQACKDANAYDFIQTLTDGLDTNVGDRGFLLSGGQKQRIAIARAIIANPKILLLDEATSALDTKSEGIVQDALDRASNGRTTIVIAHRLSTIKDADKIVVMSKGEILEQGTHRELLAQDGTYRRLVDAQQVAGAESSESTPGVAATPTDTVNGPGLVIAEDKIVAEDNGHDLEKSDLLGEENIPGIQDPPDSKLMNYIKQLAVLNRHESTYLMIGIFAAAILGYCFPAMSMLSGSTVGAMIVPPSAYHHMRHVVNVMTGWLFFLGCISFISAATYILTLSRASDALVRTVRLQLFRQLMRMDIAYYDHKDNTPGALTSILAKEAKAIEGLGGATLGQILQSLVTLIGGVVTGIPFNWRIGLVATSTVPVLMSCGFLRVWVLVSMEERSKKVYEESGALASQYTSAVRTVQSLTREKGVNALYSASVDAQVHRSRYAIFRSGILYGLSQGLVPWVIALVFWWGSTTMSRGEATVKGYMIVFMAIVLGAQAAGQIFSYAPDMGKAKEAARNVYRIMNSTPKIDSWSTEGIIPDPETVNGNVEFKNVYFRYPTRPNVPVLNGLNLNVKKGQFIALVGSSGCGKSTTISLTERFYDALKGEVLFDGINIKEYNVSALRSHIALVQQEPMLYSGTIRENIIMGWNGPESEVTQEMIESVAKKANIHEFIMSLPDGYDTVSGSRGGLLSGGQKQRIAIARALIRDPKVLLLDEATSALDSESEKVVQAALDAAAKGRTTIAVAHRLSTIKDADIIYVFENGEIAEQGDHDTLLNKGGIYSELVKLQGLEG